LVGAVAEALSPLRDPALGPGLSLDDDVMTLQLAAFNSAREDPEHGFFSGATATGAYFRLRWLVSIAARSYMVLATEQLCIAA